MGTPNFDTNTWYQITESRVDFNSALQLASDDPSSLFIAAACENCLQKWQIIPSSWGTDNAPNGSFVFRNQATGTSRQLGTCFAPNEQDSSKTRPCMLEGGGGNLAGPFTKWDITTWSTDGQLKITNVGNGTSYNLDCHRGNPLFLSSNTAPQPKQPAQHWLFSSIGVINDRTYSTGIPEGPVSTTSTSSSTSLPTSSPTTTPTPPSTSSSGLSPGAAAGIGVGVGLAALIAILIALFLFRRRRRRMHGHANLDNQPSLAGAGSEGSTGQNYGGEYGQIDHKYRFEAEESERFELNGVASAELSTGVETPTELPTQSPGDGRSPILQRI